MDVGAGHQLQRDALAVELGLKRGDGLAYLGTGVVVNARHDVRRAGEHLDAAFRRLTRHGERHRQIGRAIVDAGEHVTVKVIHREGSPARKT
jgi:hypothetical protein